MNCTWCHSTNGHIPLDEGQKTDAGGRLAFPSASLYQKEHVLIRCVFNIVNPLCVRACVYVSKAGGGQEGGSREIQQTIKEVIGRRKTEV